MPYLSRLLDSKVTDSSDKVIGHLRDVLIKPDPGKYVPLEYLSVQLKGHKHFSYIPYAYVENFSHEDISLKRMISKIPVSNDVGENHVLLRKDVLDQQIVDISGARVVRVNDLRLGNFDGDMSVLGVDVSFKGLLRRIGMGWLDFFDVLSVHLIDWRQAQPMHRSLKLDTLTKELTKLHPADLANVIEDLSVNRGSKLMSLMDSRSAAQVLREVDPHLRKIMVKYIGPEQSAEILEHMSSEEVVDLMKMLPTVEAKSFLKYLQEGKLKTVQKLLIYDDDTAGGLMSTDFVSARPSWTVQMVKEEIKKVSSKMNSILYVYVTDDEGKFLGIVSLRWLLVSSSDEKIKKLMKECPAHSTLQVDQKIQEIIPIMTKYDLYTAAVLDRTRRLVGIVTIDDVMRHLVPNA